MKPIVKTSLIALVILALVASFLLSLTFVPAALALFLKGSFVEKEPLLLRLAGRAYAFILDKALGLRYPTVGLAILTFAIGAAAYGLQHQIIGLRGVGLTLFIFAIKFDGNARRACLGSYGFGVEHDAIKTRRIHFLPNLDQITVCALHQATLHLDHI